VKGRLPVGSTLRLAAILALLLLSVGGAVAWWFVWRARPAVREDRVVICHEVAVAAQCVCDCLGGVTNGLNVLKIDARKLDCNRFFKALAGVPDDAMLWMPGEFDWLVTWRQDGRRTSFSEMMDRFVMLDRVDELENAGCESLPALFSSYVGEVRGVRPAFASLPPTECAVPELFVTKELPTLGAFDLADVDSDVLKTLEAEIRSRQNVRRVILEGCIRSRKGDSEAAVEAWARAAKRYPRDTMLLERLEHLKANGEVFYRLGKAGMAARCYEVMAQICPNDPVPVFNYGVCAQRLGQTELAERAFERARRLDAGRKASDGRLR